MTVTHRQGSSPPASTSRTPTPSPATNVPVGMKGSARRSPCRPPRCTTRSRRPRCSGGAGAGFPAGVKWGFCPPGVWPRYLVVNGDESEPGTYKDRLLMERDPHQLIEGVPDRLLRDRAVAVPSCTYAARWPSPRSASRGAQRGVRRRLRRRNMLGTDFSVDIVLHWGAGAYIVGEETALIEIARGQPRHAPAQAPVLPGRQGPVLQADHRQQRRDALQPAGWILRNGSDAYKQYGSRARPAPGCSRSRAM
jgi:NADH-quinone oxidoreductase subunit F